MNYELESVKRRGRSKMTWKEAADSLHVNTEDAVACSE